jgi:5-methylcytosine-specific restriction protein A
MPITRQDIEAHFSVGDIVASGGGRRFFRLTEFLDNRVRIQPTASPTASRLRFDKLSVVIDAFDEIDPARIEGSVGEVLSLNGLTDTQNESYLYGMAREYIRRSTVLSAVAVAEEFDKEVELAKKLTPAERKDRLERSAVKAKKITVVSTTYLRNPYVVVEVLERARGICEGCQSAAPFFRKKDKTPYLEVHHVVQLAHGGEDTVENAIALCPNCHRERHFGIGRG